MSRADFVKETTTTEGLVAYELDGAAVGFQAFLDSPDISDGDTVIVGVTDGTDFEVGTVTINAGTPDTLTRVSVSQSSNGGAPVSWGPGTKTVKLVVSAEEYDEFVTEVRANAKLTFDITAGVTPAEGEIAWDDTVGTLQIGLTGGNVILQVGQEILVKVKADNDLANGAAVYATGAVGASGIITADNFIADGSIDEIYTIGIATEDILSGQQGYITTQGVVRGITTDGSDVGETWIDGTVLYPSPTTAGQLTNVKPTAPELAIAIAIVVRAAAASGLLYIHPRLGSHLGELHDVYAPTPTDGYVLTWVSSNSRYEVIAPSVADNSVTNAKLTDVATSTIKGRVTAGTGDPEDLTVTQVQDLIDSVFLRTDSATAQSVDGAPYCVEDTLTDGATITWTPANGVEATVTLGGNRTLDLNAVPPAGTWLNIRVVQDGTGGWTLAYSADFDFGDSGSPTLSTAAGAEDVLSFRSNGTVVQFVGIAKGFA